MESIQFIGISENLSYIFTNKGVSRISAEKNDLNGRNYVPYTYEHLNVAVDILKENVDFRFKTGKISLQEYISEPRKFLNVLLEIYQPKNAIKIIKEWEQSYGDKLLLINESADKLIVENRINEAWTGIHQILEWTINPFSSEFYTGQNWSTIGGGIAQGAKNVVDYGKEKVKQAKDWTVKQAKEIKDKGLIKYVGDKATEVWNYVKDGLTKAWNCVKENPVECIMEGIRDFVMSATGTAILTGVSFIPVVGQVTNIVIFGALLIWDVYKYFSGKYTTGKYAFNIFEVIVDIAGLVFPAAGKILKTAGVGIKSFASFGAKAISKGGILLKVFNAIKSGLATIASAISKGATWLGEKLGLKFLQNMGQKASSKVQSWVDEMVAGAGGKPVVASKPTSSVKSLTPTQKAEYDNLVSAWKAEQQALGKTNLTPGQGTRNRLLKQVQQPKTFKQKVKDIWKPKPIPPNGVIVKSMGRQFLLTTTLCAALGLDGISCQQKVESGEVTPEQIDAAKQKIQQNLSKSVEDEGGVENLDVRI